MVTSTRPHDWRARRSALRLGAAHGLWLPFAALLAGCGGDGDRGDASVQLSVFAGCESEFHGSCDVLDARCQERVFSTARCLRRQPDATLPLVRVITPDELVAELESESEEPTEVGAEDPVADAAADEAVVRALELLGLAQPGELSDESYVQLFVDTVPAFYSDEDDVITLVDGALGDDSTKTLTLLHELVHALQDQSSSLAALGIGEELTYDRYLAALSVVEGEATMLESFVEAAGWGFDEDPDYRKAYLSWVPAAELEFAGQSPLLVSPRYFPYSYGARYVFDVFSSESAAGVRARFEAPPVSVLPMLLNESAPLAIEPEALLDIGEPSPPAGFVPLEPDSFGPWILAKLIERWMPDVIEADLPSHWRGDRALVWSSDEQGVATIWTLRFDSETAANELFVPLLRETLRGVPSTNAFCVQRGRDVLLGVTESESARDLWSAAIADATVASSAASAAAAPSTQRAATPSSASSSAASVDRSSAASVDRSSAASVDRSSATARRSHPSSASWRRRLSRLAGHVR